MSIDYILCTGLYVSRNTYIRAGIAEWKITKPVHIVCSPLIQYYYDFSRLVLWGFQGSYDLKKGWSVLRAGFWTYQNSMIMIMIMIILSKEVMIPSLVKLAMFVKPYF